MRAPRPWSLVVPAVFALSLAGCGPGAQDDAAPAAGGTVATSATAAETYVTRVNDLCARLLSEVLAFDIGNDPTIAAFQAKRDKHLPLIRAFDAELAAIPVTASDRSAAAAFDAYRRFSDAIDARLAAAAATGDQAEFDAVNEAVLRDLQSSPPELEDLHAAGIRCRAR